VKTALASEAARGKRILNVEFIVMFLVFLPTQTGNWS